MTNTSPSPDERTTDGLLACPHCGGDAMPWSGDWDDNSPDYTKREYFVNCGTCHAQTDRHPSEAQAVAAWNRRTPAQSLTASLERVKELEAWSKTVWCESCQNTGYIDSDGTCGNCELGREKTRRKQLEKERDMWRGFRAKQAAEYFMTEGFEPKERVTAVESRIAHLEKENGRLESEIKNGVIRWHNEVADLDQRNDRLAKECNERLAKQREVEAKVEDLEQTLALMGVDRNEQGEMRITMKTYNHWFRQFGTDEHARILKEAQEQVQSLTLARAEAKVLAYDEAAQAVLGVYICDCDPAWTNRGRHSPSCAYGICEDAAEAIRSLKSKGGSQSDNP